SNALLHLPGCLVGERDRQYGGGRHMAGCDDARHAVRDNPRLATAGAGQDEKRAFGLGHSLALLRVEALEEVHESVTCVILARAPAWVFPYLDGALFPAWYCIKLFVDNEIRLSTKINQAARQQAVMNQAARAAGGRKRGLGIAITPRNRHPVRRTGL